MKEASSSRYSCLMVMGVSSILVSSCATGTAQDLDAWHQDPPLDLPGDGAGDSLVDPVSDSTSDPYPDIPLDSVDDVATDISPDTSWDPAIDGLVDGADIIDGSDIPTDTAVDDSTTDDGSTTCSVSDLVNQLMCGAGSKCTFIDIDILGNPIPICDIAGGQGWNEICGSGGMSDNCQAGYICLGGGSGTDSICRRFCASDTTCTSYPGGANAACEIGITFGGTDVLGVTTCSFNCNPLYQTGCNVGQACRASFPGDGTFYSDCIAAGTGSGCVAGTSSDCPAGTDCFSIDDDSDTVSDYNECLPYCSYPSGSPSCTGGTMCVQGSMWPSGIGVCL